MSEKALKLLIRRKDLVASGQNAKEALSLFQQAQKLGGLTAEEAYALALHTPR